MKTILALIIPCFVLFSSCTTLLGIKESKTYSDKEVRGFNKRYVDERDVYRVDYDKFSATYDSLKNSNPRLFKDLNSRCK